MKNNSYSLDSQTLKSKGFLNLNLSISDKDVLPGVSYSNAENKNQQQNANEEGNRKSLPESVSSTDEHIEESFISHILRYKYQLKVVSLAVIAPLIYGTVLSFPSVIITDVMEYNSTIYGTFISYNDTQKDLMASLTNFGALAGLLIGGFVSNQYGRRLTIGGTAVCALISWLGIAFSINSDMSLAFRFFGGMSYGCGGMVTIAYVVEISDNFTRSVFSLVCSLSIVIGQVIGVIPSYWLHYYHVCFINCFVPALIVLLVIFVLPESPSFLTIKKRDDEARKILMRLRIDKNDVEKEMKGYKEKNEALQNVNQFQAITQKDVLIRLAIVCTIFLEQVFSGYTLFTSQTARVLQDSGNSSEATIATLLVQISQLIGGITVALVVKRIGRRGALIASGSVACIAIACLATFTLFYEDYLNSMDGGNSSLSVGYNETESEIKVDLADLFELSANWIRTSMSEDYLPQDDSYSFIRDYDWVPLLCLMVAQFGMGLGLQNVPFVLASEYFPTSIRSLGATLANCFGMIVGFTCLQLYTPMQDALTMAGLLYLFAGVAFFSIIFAFFIVQETVGKQVG